MPQRDPRLRCPRAFLERFAQNEVDVPVAMHLHMRSVTCMTLPLLPPLCSWRFKAAVALILFSVPSDLHAQRRSPPVLVRRVIDGDSIDVATMGRVNLRGIAAPRPGSRAEAAKPLAREAQERLSGLLANRWVRLEFEDETDRSGRSAYVFLDDGRFVNAWMLREGLARASAQSGLRRSRELLAAESEARSSRRGIWAESHRP